MTRDRQGPSTGPAAGSSLERSSLAALVAAWLVPGAGHFLLGRRARGALFFLVVLASFFVGVALQGNLYRIVSGQPLSLLATLGSLGAGGPYLAFRFGLAYTGDVMSAGYEAGSAFILTAGLMNILLVLDIWDICRGRKG